MAGAKSGYTWPQQDKNVWLQSRPIPTYNDFLFSVTTVVLFPYLWEENDDGYTK